MEFGRRFAERGPVPSRLPRSLSPSRSDPIECRQPIRRGQIRLVEEGIPVCSDVPCRTGPLMIDLPRPRGDVRRTAGPRYRGPRLRLRRFVCQARVILPRRAWAKHGRPEFPPRSFGGLPVSPATTLPTPLPFVPSPSRVRPGRYGRRPPVPPRPYLQREVGGPCLRGSPPAPEPVCERRSRGG